VYDQIARKEQPAWKKWLGIPMEFSQPAMLEFELSNTCNLECIMCGGEWSSAIRKNREKLPAIVSPYDQAFTEQLIQWIPGLKRANFLGGEPFLIHEYFLIWEKMASLNPDIEIAITSNGTVLNERAKKVIRQLNRVKITLSIDSLNPTTWESIRKNGKFEVLKENLQWLSDHRKIVSFSVCPMIQNRFEIPEIISFCRDHQLDVFFNVVYGHLGGKKQGIHQMQPEKDGDALIPEVSMQHLPAQALEEIIRFYRSFQFEPRWQNPLNQLIHQLENWKLAA
jgi:MoaA/NifB/PqqE/SkfB family radical SAM enzyme